ncbi:MAG: MBL fold metallo-hydrolase [Gemmatimonadales bacterium]
MVIPIVRHMRIVTLAAAMVAMLGNAARAQQNMQDVTIKIVDVAPGIYMLTGQGGNIGLSVGEDDAFVIDDQYAPLTDKILAAVARVTDKPVKFVVNTHWHGDHTGGNENMDKAGAIIVAHQNVRKQMSVEHFNAVFDSKTPASPAAALPVITFTDSLSFHWNGDEMDIVHVAPAHTDGDAIIHFKKANVIHTGDVYFNGMYPFIDVSTGGNIDGMIEAADLVLAISNSATKIIPGHGPLSNRVELRQYRSMLVSVRDRVNELIAHGASRDAVIAAMPTQDLDRKWGNGFLKPDVFVGIVFDGMTQKQ